MAFTSGFFNSLRGDRKYNAEQVSEIFDGILKDGIIPGYGQLFDVNTASNGMQITVGTGRAWFDHTWSKNDSVMVLTVPLSDITRGRYDTVVLEVNHEEMTRANSIKIVQGEPAVNPVKPTLVNTDKIKQYPLAHILVKAGVEEIKAEDIENMVGRTPTVFATGILETAPIDDLWSQWEGEWHTWFEGIKLQLSGDVVTNLQLQIDRNKTKIDSLEYQLEKTELVSRNLAKISVTVKDSNGLPVENFFLSGIKPDYTSTSNVYSDANGKIDGYATAGSFSLYSNSFLDLTVPSTTVTLAAGEQYSYEITVTRRNFAILSTGNYYTTKQYLAKVSLCGAGGGGSSSNEIRHSSSGNYWEHTGAGGGGGFAQLGEATIYPKTSYAASIGSGGSGGNTATSDGTGKDGGSTSFLGFVGVGGSGAYRTTSFGTLSSGGGGNGNGGNGGKIIATDTVDNIPGSNGGNGTGVVYITYTDTTTVGGGGGGGGRRPHGSSYNTQYTKAGSGGSPNGGGGGYVGTTAGGGGGGSCVYNSTEKTDGFRGGNGFCSVRLA